MTTQTKEVCPHCGYQCVSKNMVDEAGSFKCHGCSKTWGKDVLNPHLGPQTPCPSCGVMAGWNVSEEHYGQCLECDACGEHISRTLALLDADPDLVKRLGKSIAQHIDTNTDKCDALNKRILDLESRLSNSVSRNEELNHSIRRFNNGDKDIDDIHLECDSKIRKANETGNRALEALWGFIDAASGEPRIGNVFDRARELTPKVSALRSNHHDGHKNTPYGVVNNMFVCERGHRYPYYSDEAVNLKELGICRGCHKAVENT